MQKIRRSLTYFTIILFLLPACSTKRILKKANATYEVGEYSKALKYYQKTFRKLKDRNVRSAVMFKRGECYRILNSNNMAISSYGSAINLAYSDTIVYLHYGRLLASQGQKKGAITALETYLKYDPGNSIAKNVLSSLDSIDVWKKRNSRYVVKRVREFESRRSDFCPVYVGEDYDVVYFSSTREGGLALKNSDVTGMRPADFYMSRKDSKDKWTKPELIEGDLNSVEDEGVASLTSNGKNMYFTLCKFEENKALGASIYSSTRTGAQWGTPKLVAVLEDSTTDSLVIAHPSISSDEEELYFVSDMPGGYGGKDIWVTRKRGNNWGTPENLGAEINTAGDEVFPVIRSTGELYFSSNGWPSLGGLDIYRAVKVNDNWERNRIVEPINSIGDDFGITFEGEREKGFFTSNRNDYSGYDHIYSFELPELEFVLEGTVIDDRDGTPLSDSRLKLVGNDGTNTIIRTKKDGTYSHKLNKGADFVFLVTCRGYLNEKGALSTMHLSENENFNYDFSLSSIKKPIRLNNIFFAFNSAELNETSKLSLDTLVEVLSDNPNITIELGAHSDMIGDDQVNLELSDRRAASVMNYLISKGIASDRLESKGYGKSSPVIVDKLLAAKYDFLKDEDVLTPEFILKQDQEAQEICNQINRRTEFKVLSTTYKPSR